MSLGTLRNTDELQTAYCYWLSQLTLLNERSALKIKKQFPTFESWDQLSQSERVEGARTALGDDSPRLFTTNYDSELELAFNDLKSHADREIHVLSIDSGKYPYLLKQIPDPPLVLFVKGPIDTLVDNKNVAIIGTRDATPTGEKVATRIAKWLGEHNWCVVSGLAKGIDAAAHRGALEAKARTIAVMATPLDKVYPADNKQLADQILDAGGCWISELGLSKKLHRGSFVQRDRIQSGLSVAVIPVQTDIEGGTMHTVRYAERQKRLLLCPRPIELEKTLTQYTGIRYLIDSQRATSFASDQYGQILELLLQSHDSLLEDAVSGSRRAIVAGKRDSPKDKPSRTRRKRKPRLQVEFDFIEDGVGESKRKPTRLKELKIRMDILDQLRFEIEQARCPDGRELSNVADVKEWLDGKLRALKQV